MTINFVDDLLSVESLKPCEQLRELFLIGNPCASQEGYRDFVIATLPQLKTLDGKAIQTSDRIRAEQNYPIIREGLLSKPTNNAPVPKELDSAVEKLSITGVHLEGDEEKKRGEGRGKGKNPGFDGRWYTDIPQSGEGVGEMSGKEADERKCRDQGSIQTDFHNTLVPHTPEARLETARELERRRNSNPTSSAVEERQRLLQKQVRPPPDSLIQPDGRVLQCNEGKFTFHIRATSRPVILDVELNKVLDTSLVELDVKPNYVRVTAKGKVLQLSLAEYPVKPDFVHAERSQLTGHLVVTMMKEEAELLDDEKVNDGINDGLGILAKREKDRHAEEVKCKKAEEDRKRLKNRCFEERKRFVPRDAVDFRNICVEDSKKELSAKAENDGDRNRVIDTKPHLAGEILNRVELDADFIDDPDVPPLC